MRESGQIVLFKLPQTNQLYGKLRPALLIGKLPGYFGDWLICMISFQLRHYIEGFDEMIHEDAVDFSSLGLKAASVIRVGRLAVVDEKILIGAIGRVDLERIKRIKSGLAKWLLGT